MLVSYTADGAWFRDGPVAACIEIDTEPQLEDDGLLDHVLSPASSNTPQPSFGVTGESTPSWVAAAPGLCGGGIRPRSAEAALNGGAAPVALPDPPELDQPPVAALATVILLDGVVPAVHSEAPAASPDLGRDSRDRLSAAAASVEVIPTAATPTSPGIGAPSEQAVEAATAVTIAASAARADTLISTAAASTISHRSFHFSAGVSPDLLVAASGAGWDLALEQAEATVLGGRSLTPTAGVAVGAPASARGRGSRRLGLGIGPLSIRPL